MEKEKREQCNHEWKRTVGTPRTILNTWQCKKCGRFKTTYGFQVKSNL